MANIKEKLDQFEEKIYEEKFEDVIGERFKRYSKYIIQDRALPDIRDGLKPVQRRILYAMYTLGMFSNKPYKKSARIAGEVMGKFHPHGDSSIYEAMVRMSQNFKMLIPLIDMHGNNGSIDGDPPAAMRYTEARLSKEAELLLEDIDKKTVNFIPNFDDEELEPVVLPSKFPNLFVNGSTGISAGYATNIPPHNLKEILNGIIAYLDNPNITLDELLKIVKGPDFPTGGIVQGKEGIKEAFATGKGRIIIRSKTHFEKNKGIDQLVVTEIPYEVNKAELVKKIDNLRLTKKFEEFNEIRDESDREGLRIVVDIKKDSNKELVLNYLFKNTDLQISYNYNMVSIYNRRPVLTPLKTYIEAYVNHQKEVITNRSNFLLLKAEKRLHIVDGLIKMVSILDQVIETIRKSKNKQDSKDNLQNKFGFTEIQAEAIVTLQLYRLSSTDVVLLQEEQAELQQKIKKLNKILTNEKELINVIKRELIDVEENYSRERKTVIEDEIEEIEINKIDLISNENVIVQVTNEGYVKRSNLRSYQSTTQCDMKDEDYVIYQKEINMKDTLLLFTELGYYIYLPVYELPDTKFKDMGTYISNIVTTQQNDKIIKVFDLNDFNNKNKVVLLTKSGLIKQTLLQDFQVSRYKSAIRCFNISTDDKVVDVDINNLKNILITTLLGESLKIPENEINVTKTNSKGIIGIKLKKDDLASCVTYIKPKDDIIILTHRGNLKRMREEDIKLFSRNRRGTPILNNFKTNPHLITSVIRSTINHYKNEKSLKVYTNKDIVEINLKELKYNLGENGKQFITKKDCYKLELEKVEEVDEEEEVTLTDIFSDLGIDLDGDKDNEESKSKKEKTLFDYE